jgi:hypothetical protein
VTGTSRERAGFGAVFAGDGDGDADACDWRLSSNEIGASRSSFFHFTAVGAPESRCLAQVLRGVAPEPPILLICVNQLSQSLCACCVGANCTRRYCSVAALAGPRAPSLFFAILHENHRYSYAFRSRTARPHLAAWAIAREAHAKSGRAAMPCEESSGCQET